MAPKYQNGNYLNNRSTTQEIRFCRLAALRLPQNKPRESTTLRPMRVPGNSLKNRANSLRGLTLPPNPAQIGHPEPYDWAVWNTAGERECDGGLGGNMHEPGMGGSCIMYGDGPPTTCQLIIF